jgi:uncharacterized protein (UPF0335 family)
MDPIEELQVTAERVERFKAMYDDARRDLREKVAQARADGHDHEEIERAIARAQDSFRRFARL